MAALLRRLVRVSLTPKYSLPGITTPVSANKITLGEFNNSREKLFVCLYSNNFVCLICAQPITVPKAQKRLKKMMKEELVIIQIFHGYLPRIEHLMDGGISRIEGTGKILYVQ